MIMGERGYTKYHKKYHPTQSNSPSLCHPLINPGSRHANEFRQVARLRLPAWTCWAWRQWSEAVTQFCLKESSSLLPKRSSPSSIGIAVIRTGRLSAFPSGPMVVLIFDILHQLNQSKAWQSKELALLLKAFGVRKAISMVMASSVSKCLKSNGTDLPEKVNMA